MFINIKNFTWLSLSVVGYELYLMLKDLLGTNLETE